MLFGSDRMWGSNIVGFGTRRYKYANGREADWMLIAFSPRKRLSDVHVPTLEKLVIASVKHARVQSTAE